jgi:cyclopropane fatty-acyl-phospholipid synthase-like methyltransferase
MRSLYPPFEQYRVIYAKYYEGRSVEELCSHLGDVKDMRCLDLCAGEGLATKYFVEHGASFVWSVDESTAMSAGMKERQSFLTVHHTSVESFLHEAHQEGLCFDRVVSRQGANYWLTRSTAVLLAACMSVRGVMVFNVPNQKPPTEPRARSYIRNGLSYGEVAYSVGDIIHTVVACEGYEPHQSEIFWLSREFLFEILQPYFRVTEHVDGTSSVYVCMRNEERVSS